MDWYVPSAPSDMHGRRGLASEARLPADRAIRHRQRHPYSRAGQQVPALQASWCGCSSPSLENSFKPAPPPGFAWCRIQREPSPTHPHEVAQRLPRSWAQRVGLQVQHGHAAGLR